MSNRWIFRLAILGACLGLLLLLNLLPARGDAFPSGPDPATSPAPGDPPYEPACF